MKMYRDMTVPELVKHALNWRGANQQTSRVIYALASRLGQVHQAPPVPPGTMSHDTRQALVAHLDDQWRDALAWGLDEDVEWLGEALAAIRHPTRSPEVAKPHISLARAVSDRELPVVVHFRIWRCEGPLGSTAYGGTPTGAYHAWLRLLTQPVRIRRR